MCLESGRPRFGAPLRQDLSRSSHTSNFNTDHSFTLHLSDHLTGLVVKVSTSKNGRSVIDSAFCQDFSRSSHTSDYNIDYSFTLQFSRISQTTSLASWLRRPPPKRQIRVDSHFCRDFSGSSHTSDLNTGHSFTLHLSCIPETASLAVRASVLIIIIIIIIIAFKGAIRDLLQSPHSAANCLQHVRSSGPERNRVQITCNTSSAYFVQLSCYVPLGTKGQLSY